MGQEAQRPQAPRTRQGGQGRGSTPRGATGQGHRQSVRPQLKRGEGGARNRARLRYHGDRRAGAGVKDTYPSRGWDGAAGAGRMQPPAQWRGDRLVSAP